MKADKDIGSYYVNLVSKIGLGLAFGLIGGSALLSGSWVFGGGALILGGIFANNAYELFNKHSSTDLTPETAEKKQNAEDSEQNKDKKKKRRKHLSEKLIGTPRDIEETLTQQQDTRKRKQKHNSEPRHIVPKLDLSEKRLSQGRSGRKSSGLERLIDSDSTQSSQTSEIKLESNPNYLPSTELETGNTQNTPQLQLKNKRSPNRLSQKPQLESIESAREMTVEELDRFVNEEISQQQTPKKTYYKAKK